MALGSSEWCSKILERLQLITGESQDFWEEVKKPVGGSDKFSEVDCHQLRALDWRDGEMEVRVFPGGSMEAEIEVLPAAETR